MGTFIALLRGINVGGTKPVPMAALRALVEELGFADVRTYIQSGNVVFRGSGSSEEIEAQLERAVAARFGFAVDIVVRTGKEWSALLQGNPFAEAAARDPSHVQVLLSKRRPHPDAVPALQARAQGGERIAAAQDALWIHYPAGIGRSKLSPSLLDRLVGSPVTARNVATAQKLGEMAHVPLSSAGTAE